VRPGLVSFSPVILLEFRRFRLKILRVSSAFIRGYFKEMSWYYRDIRSQQIGPVDDAAFAGLVRSGTVAGVTPVWRSGMAAWQPYQEIWAVSAAAESARSAEAWQLGGGDASAAATTTTTPVVALTAADVLAHLAYCSECGRSAAPEELAPIWGRRVCPSCKPFTLQRLREGLLRQLTAFRYAGFWIRVGAATLDYFIKLPVQFVVGLIAGVLLPVLMMRGGVNLGSPDYTRAQLLLNVGLQLFSFGFELGYATFFTGKFGGTPGKLICGLRVIRSDGAKLTYRRAALRAVAKLLNSFTLGLSYLIVAVDPERRGLHDFLCDTRVIYK